jgi:hypothetical protein
MESARSHLWDIGLTNCSVSDSKSESDEDEDESWLPASKPRGVSFD